MTVVVVEDAAQDLESGRRFYDSREPGVGDYFVESLLSDLSSLSLYSGIHPIHFGYYRMLSKRFPFGIYYEIESDTAYVYAILDMRRNPLWIRGELRRRQ
jgi:hypothetical protein